MGKVIIGAFGGTAIMALVTAVYLDAPLVLANVSPSSPLGVYRYVGALPEAGDYIAFHATGSSFARITEASGLPMPTTPMLKPVAAYPGDRVCFDPATDSFRINNGAPIGFQERIWQGRLLPTWQGCRDLTEREYFTYAPRIPNALDSRFYGPVDRSIVIGAYRPLWIEQTGEVARHERRGR